MKKDDYHYDFRKKNSFLFVLPALFFIFVFMVYPLARSFYLSLTEYNFLFDNEPRFIGFSNYIKLFSDKYFIDALSNTLFFSFCFFPLLIVISFTLALLISKRLKGVAIFRTSIFLPVIVPLALTGIIFQWILNENYGLVNHFLVNILNMPQLACNWLTHEKWAMYSIILISLWKYVRIEMILFLAGLQTIPKELHEMARMDGLNPLQEIFYVIIPNLKETFVVAGIWGILTSLKIFEPSFVMTQGGPGTSTLVLYQYFWQSAFKYYDMGYASAIGYFMGLMVITLSLINVWLAQKKV